MALSVVQLTHAHDSLIEARAQGVRRVRDQNGEEVEYKTDGEMARALAAIDTEITAIKNGPRPTIVTCNTSKGL